MCYKTGQFYLLPTVKKKSQQSEACLMPGWIDARIFDTGNAGRPALREPLGVTAEGHINRATPVNKHGSRAGGQGYAPS